MAARLAAVNAELMLHAEHVCVAEIQKIRSTPVGVEIFFQQLKADALRVVVALHAVIDSAHKTICDGGCGCDGLTQIMGEGRDAAEPW